jgi:hypothetical protein
LPATNPKVTHLHSEIILSLQRLVRVELVLLRRLAVDRRIASIFLPVLRRSGLTADLTSGKAARFGGAAKSRTAG